MTLSRTVLVTPAELRRWPLAAPGGDKESRGRILVVGGTAETPGAVQLAGEAALRAGAGKLQIATSGTVAPLVAVAVPEARVLPLDGLEGAAPLCDVVLVGPGLADVGEAATLVDRVAGALGESARLVVDALGTAYLTDNPDGLEAVAGRCVVNGNPDEIAHILGVEEDEVVADLRAAALEAAHRTGAVVLCGGEDKLVASPDGRSWRVEAGSRGLGVSGSGDVQAGIVAGLLARGAGPEQAAVWGAFLHGTAGDRLGERLGPLGYLAREIPGEVPAVLADLET